MGTSNTKQQMKYSIKNHTDMKKVGYTLKFLFGIY